MGRRLAAHEMPSLQIVGRLCIAQPQPPNWKEQFGRVLIEAMSCGVPVIGSTCGEIPNVVGEAGLLFPKRTSPPCAATCKISWTIPLCATISPTPVVAAFEAHYTMRQIAVETVNAYTEVGLATGD